MGALVDTYPSSVKSDKIYPVKLSGSNASKGVMLCDKLCRAQERAGGQKSFIDSHKSIQLANSMENKTNMINCLRREYKHSPDKSKALTNIFDALILSKYKLSEFEKNNIVNKILDEFLPKHHHQASMKRTIEVKQHTVPKSFKSVSQASDFPRKTPIIKRGLPNIGNSCYLNASLNFVFDDPVVKKMIQEFDKDKSSPIVSRKETLLEMLKAVKEKKDQQLDCIAEYRKLDAYLQQLIFKRSSPLRGQEDATETLLALYDVLELPVTQVENRSKVTKADGKEIIDRKMETFAMIPIEVSNSLEKSLKLFSREEKMKGLCEDKYRSTQYEIMPSPSMNFYLKRFKTIEKGRRSKKITETMKTPNEIQIKGTSFELRKAMIHIGDSVKSGHYFQIVKSGNRWLMQNDRQEIVISDDRAQALINRSAYVLNYMKK